MESFKQLASVPSGQGEGLASVDLPGCVVSGRFLKHPDREVRLWAARCLAEALRIREPGPDWLEPDRLPAVLGLFVEQVGLLLDQTGCVRAGALEFVERLADWDSGSVFALAFQCPDPGGLLSALVEACLHAARGELAGPDDAPEAGLERAERALCRLVSSVLVEAEELPAPGVAVLPLINELKPAHQSSLARRFVRRTLEELARRDAALAIDLALQAELFPKVEEEVESVAVPPKALLSVVRELFEVDRALVARTLPRLGALLRCKDVECRGALTGLFGRLLVYPRAAGGTSQAALLFTHPLLLEGFLERFDDGEASVRLAALDGGASLLTAAAALVREGLVSWGGEARGLVGKTDADQKLVDAAGEVAARLVQRRLDPDEGVRLRVVDVAIEVAEGAQSGDELRLVEEALPLIFERVLDRRGPKLREACARGMAQLFAKHALSRWTSGEDAAGWEWVPRLLCQAYSTFLASHAGGTALLEELIEMHLLGCTGAGKAPQRGQALRGLFEAVCEQEDSAAGLRLLLCRKRDANAALWQFLRRRRARTGGGQQDPVAAADALACKAEGGQIVQANSEAALALEARASFGRFNPLLEEPRAKPETHLEVLGALEAVKDKAVWDHLERLCNPAAAFATPDRTPLLVELQRLLRFHRLTALWPLLRRALLCTWLLPDQVPALLEARPGAPAAARQLIAELPKYFPGAFAPHAEAVAGRLAARPEDAFGALRSLAAAGKRLAAAGDGSEPWPGALPAVDPERYTDALLEAVAALAPHRAARGPACRKAVHALGLLPLEERPGARARLLRWADGGRTPGAAPARRAAALHLAAACLAAGAEAPGAGPTVGGGQAASWLEVARQALLPGAEAKVEVRHAAAEVCGAIGDEDDLAAMLDQSSEVGASVSVHAVVSILRGLRRGSLCLSTRLLSHLSAQVCSILASQQPSSQRLGDLLLGTLQKTQRSACAGVRLADHLRLCATLPAIFALSPVKAQQEASQRTLQASLRRATQQAAARRESLLDFAVACFLHFLSRQDFFQVESAAIASKFPESTRLSDFFCKALSRSDPARGTEHLGLALQVCQRSRHFADRERPASDGVHKAANVLRYAVERMCPELARQPPPLSLGVTLRGSMPASLFVVRLPSAPSADTPALQEAAAAAAPLALPQMPLPLQDAAAAPPPDAAAHEEVSAPAPAPPPATATTAASPSAGATVGEAAGAIAAVAGGSPQPVHPSPPRPATAVAHDEATPEATAAQERPSTPEDGASGARARAASGDGGPASSRRRAPSQESAKEGGDAPAPRASPRLAAMKRPAAAGAGGAAACQEADGDDAEDDATRSASTEAKRRRKPADPAGPAQPARAPPPPAPAAEKSEAAAAAQQRASTPKDSDTPGAPALAAGSGGGFRNARRRVASPLIGQEGGDVPPPRASPRLAALKRSAAPPVGVGGTAASEEAARGAAGEGAAGAGAKRRRESAGGLGGGAS